MDSNLWSPTSKSRENGDVYPSHKGVRHSPLEQEEDVDNGDTYPSHKRARYSPLELEEDVEAAATASTERAGKASSVSNFRNLSACNRCRLRKNRCDQRLPSCASCEKANVICVGYDPVTKREIPRSYVFYLESRIAQLESSETSPALSIGSKPSVISVQSIPSTTSRSSTFSSRSVYSSGSLDSGIGILPEDQVKRTGVYICIVCGNSFDTRIRLHRHERTHSEYYCSLCGDNFGFGRKDLLWKHNCRSNLPLSPSRDSPHTATGDNPETKQGRNSLMTLVRFAGLMSSVGDPTASTTGTVSPFLAEADVTMHNIPPEKQSTAALLSDRDSWSPKPSIGLIENKQTAVVSSESGTGNDSDSSFSEYETDWDEDETVDNSQDFELFTIPQAGCDNSDKARGEVISKVLSPMQQALLDRMMTEFWIIFKQENDFFHKDVRSPTDDIYRTCHSLKEEVIDATEGQGKSNTGQSLGTAKPAPSNQTTTNHPDLKRKRGKQNDQGEEDNEERDQKRPRTLSNESQDPEHAAKFACPYRKHNPIKYGVRKWRSCALTPLETVARVKAHLYRHHRIFPCHRCKKLFKNQDQVTQHLKELEGCDLVDTELGDGLTSDIVEKLKSRKKSDKDQSESERWAEIYKLLFPVDIIPEPYFEAVQENITRSPDSAELANYEEYCRQELPRSVRTVLEGIIRSESSPIEEILRSQLVTIIRDCQDRVFSRYRESVYAGIASPTRVRKGSSASITISPVPADDTSLSCDNKATDAPTSHSVPSFLQPTPPQKELEPHHLSSPAILIPAQTKPMSDSGYASSFSDLPLSSSPQTGSTSGFSLDLPLPPEHATKLLPPGLEPSPGTGFLPPSAVGYDDPLLNDWIDDPLLFNSEFEW